MEEPATVAACLSLGVTALSGVVAYLYSELKTERASRVADAEARRMSDTAHSARIEALLREQIERDREESERNDRLEDIVLGLRESADRPRVKTDPKKARST